jgi:hypothetical protein
MLNNARAFAGGLKTLKRMRKVQPADVGNGTIAVSLKQLQYLTAEDFIIEQQTANI